jgi:hypothetical protein
MNAGMYATTAALADLDADHLHALIQTVNGVAQVAPGLLAWIEHTADWEISRRRGVDFPLLSPDAAIPPEEGAISLDAATMLRQQFAQDDRVEARGVAGLLNAVVGLLSGSAHSH